LNVNRKNIKRSQADYEKQRREKEKERKVLGQQKKDSKKTAQQEEAAMMNRMLQAAKTLERMVNQNIYDEISQGFLNFMILNITK
jgi:dynein intermediate chain 1